MGGDDREIDGDEELDYLTRGNRVHAVILGFVDDDETLHVSLQECNEPEVADMPPTIYAAYLSNCALLFKERAKEVLGDSWANGSQE